MIRTLRYNLFLRGLQIFLITGFFTLTLLGLSTQIVGAETGAVSLQSAQSLTEGQAEQPDGGGWSILGKIGETFSSIIGSIIAYTFGQLFALILQLVGFLFEAIIYISVASFGLFVGDAVTTAWEVVRNIINTAIIFVLLYIAIQTIIGRGPELRKVIASVVFFALLTNFSLLFTKSIIDVSNIIALQFYNASRGGGSGNNAFDATPSLNDGLATRIMGQTGMINLWADNSEVRDEFAEGKDGEIGGITRQIMNLLLMVVMMFVFLQAAFLLFGRAVALIFSMVFSPLMFVGTIASYATGKTRSVSKWWATFLEQVAVAPVFFLTLWIALYATGSITESIRTQVQSFSNQVTFLGAASLIEMVGIIISSAIVVLAFQAVLRFTKNFSKGIGDFTVRWGTAAIGYGAGRPLGYAGRRAGFAAGRYMQREGSLYKRAEQALTMSKSPALQLVGRGLSKFAVGVKDSSYEAQNLGKTKVGKGVSKLLDLSGRIPGVGTDVTKGVNFGSASTKGLEERRKETDKKTQSEIENRLSTTGTALGARTYDIKDSYLEYVLENGERRRVSRTTEDVKTWGDKVREANEAIKKQNLALKTSYIESQTFENLSAVDKWKERIKNAKGEGSGASENRKKAIEAALKKVRKGVSSEKDKEMKKNILKQLEEEFDKDVGQEGLGFSETEALLKEKGKKMKDMTDMERAQVYQSIVDESPDRVREMDDQIKTLQGKKEIAPADRDGQVRKLRDKKRAIVKKAEQAKRASKEIERLRKETSDDGGKKEGEKKPEDKKEEKK